MLSESHLEQLREAFPTTEWEVSGPHPNSWTGRFRGGLVLHLASHLFDEVHLGVTVWDGAEPYVRSHSLAGAQTRRRRRPS